MPATTTLKQIADQVVKEMGIGYVIPSYTGSTTTLTLTTTGASELRGPFTGRKIAIGSPVLITSTVGAGDDTYVSDWNPATGIITVSPAITNLSTDAVIITEPGIEHADRLLNAINLAVLNRVARWQMTPLTFLPDGDLRGTTVSGFWTSAVNGAAAYVNAQVFPTGPGAGVGDAGLYRVLQLTTSGGSSSVDNNGIRVQLSKRKPVWYFLTAIRLVSGTGTATFSIRDVTNSADITLTVMRGNDSHTLTTTTFGDFMVCEGTFQTPATCAEITARLSCSATGMVAQMAPIIMYPRDAVAYPLPNRIDSDDFIGNFHYGDSWVTPGGMEDISFSEPITTAGRTHRFVNNGDHRTVNFNFRPTYPVWYDELVSDAELTAVTTTTTFPLDQVVKYAKFELAKYRYQRERARQSRDSNGNPNASVWRTAAREALREAENSPYEPPMMHVYGRI